MSLDMSKLYLGLVLICIILFFIAGVTGNIVLVYFAVWIPIVILNAITIYFIMEIAYKRKSD